MKTRLLHLIIQKLIQALFSTIELGFFHSVLHVNFCQTLVTGFLLKYCGKDRS